MKTPEFLFLKSYSPKASNFIKKRNSNTGDFCEFCESFNNTFFRAPPVATECI